MVWGWVVVCEFSTQSKLNVTAIAGLNIHLVSSVLHYGSGIGHGRSVINPFRLLANISDVILTLFIAVISIQN